MNNLRSVLEYSAENKYTVNVFFYTVHAEIPCSYTEFAFTDVRRSCGILQICMTKVVQLFSQLKEDISIFE